VAVWVGFIALFGTAVQTAVVMVIYLDEAVERRRVERGPEFSHADLRQAVIEGALLRLRPKVMTVSTVVAGLLPIMWSTRPGAEVMKPLAAPVLGGMVSSLAHVLLVTPLIFFVIRERQMGLAATSAGAAPPRTYRGTSWRRGLVFAGILIVLVLAVAGTWLLRRQETTAVGQGPVIRTIRSGALTILLRSSTGALQQGRNTFALEFRGVDGALVDVGTVRATGNMPMPGMVMPGGLEVQPSARHGVYDVSANFGMSGTWQMAIQWNGPAGQGSVNFDQGVR
jgi:hypothetical protein